MQAQELLVIAKQKSHVDGANVPAFPLAAAIMILPELQKNRLVTPAFNAAANSTAVDSLQIVQVDVSVLKRQAEDLTRKVSFRQLPSPGRQLIRQASHGLQMPQDRSERSYVARHSSVEHIISSIPKLIMCMPCGRYMPCSVEFNADKSWFDSSENSSALRYWR